MDPVDVAAYAGEVGDTYPGPLMSPGERRKSDVECPDRSLADPTETGSAKRSVQPRDRFSQEIGSAKRRFSQEIGSAKRRFSHQARSALGPTGSSAAQSAIHWPSIPPSDVKETIVTATTPTIPVTSVHGNFRDALSCGRDDRRASNGIDASTVSAANSQPNRTLR